MVTFAKLI